MNCHNRLIRHLIIGLSLSLLMMAGCTANVMQLDRKNTLAVKQSIDAQKISNQAAKENDQATSKELEGSTREFLSPKSANTQIQSGNGSSFKIQ